MPLHSPIGAEADRCLDFWAEVGAELFDQLRQIFTVQYCSLNNNSCSYNNFTRKRPYLHSNFEFLKPLIYKVNDLFFKCCTIPSGAGAERQSRSWATEMQLDAAIERQSRCRSRPVVLYVSGTRFLHWRVQNLIKFCFCRYRYLTNTSRITFQQKKSHKWTVKCMRSPLMFFSVYKTTQVW